MKEKSYDRQSDAPIACTLSAADLQDRQLAWLKVGRYITASATIPGGLSFDFANASGLPESLTELVRLEAECCAWMAFALTGSSAGTHLAISAMGPDGEQAVRASFAPLLESSQ
jgi:hypothetical protein